MELPETFHFIHQRRVEWADTDTAGITHFTAFLRYAEESEHSFWRSLGWSVHPGNEDNKTGWPRLSVSCDFAKPVRFEQVLRIGMRILEVGNTTLRYGFWMFDDDGTESGLVASGELTIIHVVLDREKGRIQKMPISEDLREQLESLDEV